LHEQRPPLDPELLGLFVGVAIDGHSYLSTGGELPPRIYLFKRNLERTVTRSEDLTEQIRVTLYHELGHFLGMDEDDLDDAGYR
jgi:predicted Zn-dependent protease with MMP-like domain